MTQGCAGADLCQLPRASCSPPLPPPRSGTSHQQLDISQGCSLYHRNWQTLYKTEIVTDVENKLMDTKGKSGGDKLGVWD